MNRAQPRNPRIEGNEQVECLVTSYLADDDARRAHPQRFAHQPAQRDLSDSFQTRPATLQAHDIGVRQGKFEGFLHRDHALTVG